MTQRPEAAVPPPEISAFHEELSAASAEIAAASQELDAPIAAIERYLDILRIHVPAWVKVKGWEDSYDNYWKRELGYDYVGDGWHIAIREVSGYLPDPDREEVRTWAFGKSPKKSRISAVDKLPELLQDIAKEALKTARRMKEKAAEATAFTASLNAAKVKK